MAQKVMSSDVLLNPLANGLVDAAVSSVTTDERLGRDDIAALGTRIANVDLGSVQFTTVPVSDGSHDFEGESTVLWDTAAATSLFQALRDDVALPEPQSAQTVEVPPGDISLRVIAPSPTEGGHDRNPPERDRF